MKRSIKIILLPTQNQAKDTLGNGAYKIIQNAGSIPAQPSKKNIWAGRPVVGHEFLF
jgi:hypothetical protein